MSAALPKVTLLGRTNAGKSTLFNTLASTSQAIVSSVPGTTRDLNRATVTWRGTTFELIDSGGLDASTLGEIETYVQKKSYQALAAADLVLLVMDGRNDLIRTDREIAKAVQKNRRPVILVVNKIDGTELRKNITPDFFKLGLSEPALVSALSGAGTGDLLDLVVQKIPHREQPIDRVNLRLSIIGKTNVGKSSLLNALTRSERSLVSPLPHTTREPQDMLLTFRGSKILLVDTAGIRKKKTLAGAVERLSVEKTLHAIERSDVALFIFDASEHPTSQDQYISHLALSHRKGIIIVINKWDLILEKSPTTPAEFEKRYRRYFAELSWAPIVFVSAITKQRVDSLLERALRVQAARNRAIPDEELRRLTLEAPPKKAKPSKNKKSADDLRLSQTGTNPPTFSLATRHPDRIHVAYLNLLEKKLRTKYDFEGTPIIISFLKAR